MEWITTKVLCSSQSLHLFVVFLPLATLEDMEIHQMDVKIAFLNGKLEKVIYMEQHLKGSCTKEVNISCISFTSPCMV
jgi:hypothetical protein